MCGCIYIYIYMCVYVYVHIYVYVYMYMYMYIHIFMYIYMYMYIYIYHYPVVCRCRMLRRLLHVKLFMQYTYSRALHTDKNLESQLIVATSYDNKWLGFDQKIPT